MNPSQYTPTIRTCNISSRLTTGTRDKFDGPNGWQTWILRLFTDQAVTEANRTHSVGGRSTAQRRELPITNSQSWNQNTWKYAVFTERTGFKSVSSNEKSQQWIDPRSRDFHSRQLSQPKAREWRQDMTYTLSKMLLSQPEDRCFWKLE